MLHYALMLLSSKSWQWISHDLFHLNSRFSHGCIVFPCIFPSVFEVHRDLKTANVILDDDLSFGMETCLVRLSGRTCLLMDTILQFIWDDTVDMWMTGCQHALTTITGCFCSWTRLFGSEPLPTPHKRRRGVDTCDLLIQRFVIQYGNPQAPRIYFESQH